MKITIEALEFVDGEQIFDKIFELFCKNEEMDVNIDEIGGKFRFISDLSNEFSEHGELKVTFSIYGKGKLLG